MAARLALVLATCSTFTASAATGEGCAASDANLVDLRNTLCQSIGSFPGFPDCASPEYISGHTKPSICPCFGVYSWQISSPE